MVHKAWRSTDSVFVVALLALGVLTRFALLNYPRAVIFDEYHFGKFVNGYLTGEYFFDIHPPLGKLVLAAAARAGGYNGTSMAWAHINDPIPAAVNLFALRAGPALQGSLLSPLLFCAGRALGLSQPAALVAAAGALFDVCCLIEQRLVLTDATLLLGFALHLAGSFASDHYTPLSRAWLLRVATAGAGIAIAVCTKWTGAGCLALGGLHSLVALYRSFARGTRLSHLVLDVLARLVLLLLVPALCYLLCAYLHFALLPLTGPGARFMTAAFRASLHGENATSLASAKQGNPNPTPLSLAGRFVELNREMFRANANIKKGHDWASKWYDWPLMRRSVLYWVGKQSPYIAPAVRPIARIYAIGTPAVWWLAAAAPTCFVAWATARVLAPSPPDKPASSSAQAAAEAPAPAPAAAESPAAGAEAAAPNGGAASGTASPHDLLVHGGLLLVGYLANWLPFMAVERAAFLYHFLPSLLHALLLVGVLLDAVVPPTPLSYGRSALDDRILEANPTRPLLTDGASAPEGLRWLVAGALVYLMAACFAYFAPLAYGTPLSREDFDARMWIEGWR